MLKVSRTKQTNSYTVKAGHEGKTPVWLVCNPYGVDIYKAKTLPFANHLQQMLNSALSLGIEMGKSIKCRSKSQS